METSSNLMCLEKQIKRIDRLFLRFAAMYGHAWRSLFKDDEFLAYTKREWMASLEKFDNSTLCIALDHCSKNERYPPSLPLFVETCASKSKRHKFFQRDEEEKRSDPTVARMHLNNIRNILNMSQRSE